MPKDETSEALRDWPDHRLLWDCVLIYLRDICMQALAKVTVVGGTLCDKNNIPASSVPTNTQL